MKWAIIKTFATKNKSWFCYKDVLTEFPDKDPRYLSALLASMVTKGMLLKISRNVYNIIPLNANPDTYSPDSRLVARSIMNGEGYYIAFSSALHFFGLTDEAGSRTMVATKRQRKPSIQKFAGTEFQFVFQSSDRFFGFESTWVNDHEQIMVSDLEKTLVDAVSKPRLCGGITGISKAIFHSQENVDLQKLFYYFERNRSNAAKKRYLFLADLLGIIWSSDHERMIKSSGASISLLDPDGPDRGVKNSRFRLKVNVDVYALKNSILSR